MNNSAKILLIIALAAFAFFGIVYTQESDFTIQEQGKTRTGAHIDTHLEFLGLGLRYPGPVSVVPYWLRMPEIETPGDYFQYPEGANLIPLADKDISEIRNSLKDLIEDKFYDSLVFGNLKGYQYDMKQGKIHRREYYVKYSRGDTIYVISGLIGKFLSFYRSLPGKDVISIDQLKKEVEKLSPSIKLKNEIPIIKKANEHIYFNEYLDRDQKIRIRNYQIVESWQETDKDRDDSIGKYYNLIEITKFLDEEAMP
ncbi:MAG: hypothetical protein JSW64_12885 [Candidatus Zixiibacteriota bacterium]|nr:MAG: hypothetical protein JSW64_12885 [candidate division Zixibacteria bacterium]